MKKWLILVCLLLIPIPVYAEESEEEANTDFTCRQIDVYDYSQPVPASFWANDDYFNYVFMAGDSRLGTIRLLGSIPYKNMYYLDSLTIAKFGITKYGDSLGDYQHHLEEEAWDNGMEYIPNEEDKDKTLMDLLMETDMPVIYLMLGVNELGFSADKNIESYRILIEATKEAHPKSDIYIFLLYTPEFTYGLNTQQCLYYSQEWNSKLRQLCQEERVFFLDLDEVVANEEGYLKANYHRGDGVHFNPEGARLASDYIREHVAWRDIYVKEICE